MATEPVKVDANARWGNNIPPAVRRQAERAEQLRQEEEARQRGEPQEGKEQAPQEARPEPTNPEQQFSENQPQQPLEPAQDAQRAAQERREQPPNVDQRSDADPNDDTWKRRFESEQGRTNKLRQDVAGLSTELGNLRRLLATVQTPSQPAPAADPQQTFDPKITSEEREKWGDDLLEIIERKAREIASRENSELRQRLDQLGGQVQNVGQAAAADAYTRMLNTLDTTPETADWRAINEDPEFVAWVNYPDPLSGKKRQDMLVEAWNVNDASRVAAFFTNFKRESNRSTAAPAPPAPTRQAAPQQPSTSLERLAAPGKSRTAPPANGGAADKPFITTGDITRFYADSTAGKFRGLEAEAKAYEQEIFTAQREGRVRQGPPSRT